MSEVSIGWSFILGFTNCIILFSIVSFLLVIVCHLYMLLQKKKKNFKWNISRSLRIRKVISLHKAGDSSDLGSYRPISGLTYFFKSVMYNRIYKHLQEKEVVKHCILPIMLSFNYQIKFMKILKKMNIQQVFLLTSLKPLILSIIKLS